MMNFIRTAFLETCVLIGKEKKKVSSECFIRGFIRSRKRIDRNSCCSFQIKCLVLVGLLSFKACAVIVTRPKSSRACSTGCPSGTYESSPCTNFRDRVCQECTKCSGSTYEAKACSGSTDRQCIHVAHPLLITGDITTNKFLDELHRTKHEMKKRKKLKVEASSNVHLEDLHNARNLETTYYVTDMTQASDFFWDRESGLRVNIGILNVHLIPEYTDVDHESDNKYVLSNPDGSEDKTKFRSIMREYCRHPIPDYYSITLEISRDRTTAAKHIICDLADPTRPKCPLWYKDGDSYLHRTANDACHKMAKGTFPEPLQPAANSIVCTEHSAIMHDIFNQTSSTQRPITFPPKKCRTSKSRCDQCIEQVKCQTLDLFERKCCQVDCYTLLDCKVAYSEECTSSEVECAMGDVYRYTIQPIFNNIKNTHQCHIRRHHPDILYEIFYFVQIPGTGFQTSKVHKTIYASDLGYQSRGENQADFLTIEHNIGIELQDEFILHGQQVDIEHINYTVQSMKSLDQLRSGKLIIHEISPRIFVAAAQFNRPFDYSTSTWTQQNDCNKNVSKFKPDVPYNEMDAQGVNVIIKNSAEPYHYFLKSIENPPFIRFNVPGNMPILPYYYRDNGPILFTNSSLSATLDLLSSGKVWDIQLSGKLSGCPGYLGVVINNRLDQEELFRYDLLIVCPSEFNVTFKVPNWGQQQDKTFDLHLEDAKYSYDIFMTQMTFEPVHLELEPEAIQMPQQQHKISYLIFLVVIASLFVSLVAFIAIYIYTEAAKERFFRFPPLQQQEPIIKSYCDVNSTSQHQNSLASPSRVMSVRAMKRNGDVNCASLFLCRLYIMFRVLYSIVFTFTIFYIVLMSFISQDIKELSQIDAIQMEKRNLSVSLSRSIESHGIEEMLRQRELVASMHSSCSHYVGELFDSMAHQMYKILTMEHCRDNNLFGLNTSLSNVVQERMQKKLKEYSVVVARFRKELRSQVIADIIPSMFKYKKYLNNLFHNNWLNFPQKLYNESSYSDDQPLLAIKSGSNLTGAEVDFVNFMEVQEMEEVQLWAAQFWQRFGDRFPRLPSVPSSSLVTNVLQCTIDEDDLVPNLTRRTPPYQLQSSHFFTSQYPDSTVSSSSSSSGTAQVITEFIVSSSNDEHDRSKSKPRKAETTSFFSLNFFFESVDVDMLRVVFLGLDGLVIVYRCTLTYITVKALNRRFSAAAASASRNSRQCRLTDELSDALNQTVSETLGYNYNHNHESMIGLESLREVQKDNELSNENNIYTDPQTLIVQNSVLQRPGTSLRQNAGVVKACGSNSMTSRPQRYISMRAVFGRLIENGAFPKVIILAVFILLIYAFLRLVVIVLDVKFLVSVRAFGVFVNMLNVQVNQTNSYILDETKFFNEVTMKVFEKQMQVELENLQSMLDYFNAEQKRLVNNYIFELCSLVDLNQSHFDCDITIFSPPSLTIPMIPCNFVPIQPQLYSGLKIHEFENQVEMSFKECIEASRNILLKLLYAVLITVTVMMIVHIFGWIVCRCLRLKQRSLSCPTGVRRLYTTSDSSIQMFIHQNEGSEYDSDDNEMEFMRHTTITNMTLYRGRTGVAEFKYSETNV